MSRNRIIPTVAVGLTLVAGASFAAILYDSRGTWPESWPDALEPLREQARTVQVANGTQETVYEIPFKSREAFEQAWPHLLKVKSPGGILILEDWPSPYHGESKGPGVRLSCPHRGVISTDPIGVTLELTWPPVDADPTYEPPEYVVQKGGAWVPYTPSEKLRGFRYRARVDVTLVVDGDIVNLNRIRVPQDTKIIDRRFDKVVVDTDGGK